MTPEEIEARNKMVLENLGLVHWIYHQVHQSKFKLSRVGDKQDVIQIGMLGLIRAVEKFDPARNIRFSSFAVAVICRKINKAILTGGLVRTPTARNSIQSQKVLHKYRQARRTIFQMGSVNGQDRGLKGHNVPDPNWKKPFAEVDEGDENPGRDVERLMARLDKRRREVVRLRFFQGLKLKEIGKELGVTKERARQLLKSALEIMREQL